MHEASLGAVTRVVGTVVHESLKSGPRLNGLPRAPKAQSPWGSGGMLELQLYILVEFDSLTAKMPVVIDL